MLERGERADGIHGAVRGGRFPGHVGSDWVPLSPADAVMLSAMAPRSSELVRLSGRRSAAESRSFMTSQELIGAGYGWFYCMLGQLPGGGVIYAFVEAIGVVPPRGNGSEIPNLPAHDG